MTPVETQSRHRSKKILHIMPAPNFTKSSGRRTPGLRAIDRESGFYEFYFFLNREFY